MAEHREPATESPGELFSSRLLLDLVCDAIGGRPAKIVRTLCRLGWAKKEIVARRLGITPKAIAVNLYRFLTKAKAAAAEGLLPVERRIFESIFPSAEFQE